MMTQSKILVFAGSTREGSLNRKLARLAAESLEKRGAQVTLADLRDYPMPMYDGDLEATHGLPERAKAFKELLRAHDALVIASPEYNGSFSALLKNVIDWTSRAEPGEKPAQVFRGKTAVLLATSPGPGGGKRGLKHVRELLQMIGVEVLPQELSLPKGAGAFTEAGSFLTSEDATRLEGVLSGLMHSVLAA
jgi:NAD(P)H-dependent FMN reductase